MTDVNWKANIYRNIVGSTVIYRYHFLRVDCDGECVCGVVVGTTVAVTSLDI